MVTPEKVKRAIEKIIEISHPRQLILFGSYVRGDINSNSDLDVLVVVDDDTVSPRQESVRIRRALRGISMSMDILVISEARLRTVAALPGLIYSEALNKGETVYRAA